MRGIHPCHILLHSDINFFILDMRAASCRHSLLSVDVDVCMCVSIFETKYLGYYKGDSGLFFSGSPEKSGVKWNGLVAL